MSAKILVVDDSRVARTQVTLILSDAAYTVVEACDGADGLEKLRENKDIAMVICDVNMPVMTGLEMLAKVKADPALAGVPVVMLTTEAQPQLIKEARSVGAIGWFIKPVKAELLLSAVRRVTATPVARAG